MSDLVDLLLSLPLYTVCALGVFAGLTFRRRAAPRLRRWRWPALVALLLALLMSLPVTGNALTRHIEQQYAPPILRDADRHPDNLVVVLTAGWFRVDGDRVDVRLGEDGWERLDAGVKLWRKIGGTLLFVGAPAPDGSGRSCAGAMADVAKDLGVPASAILVEPKSRNTYENFTFSADVLGAHRDHLWLVTSALHMPRSMAVARKLGLAPVAYPCFYHAHRSAPLSYWLPSNEGPLALAEAMHEVLGGWWYRLRSRAE